MAELRDLLATTRQGRSRRTADVGFKLAVVQILHCIPFSINAAGVQV
jgi:hypothetical protein